MPSEENFVEIPLTLGLKAKIDREDLARVVAFKWQAETHRHTHYAGTSIKTGKSFKRIRLHRLIMNVISGQAIDHINGDGLDNRKANLRIASQRVNSYNRRPKYKYLGVRFCKKSKAWRACIKHEGKYRVLGLFSSEDEDGKVAQEFRKKNGLL